jgi:PTS system nitrogen regulatory IIA component
MSATGFTTTSVCLAEVFSPNAIVVGLKERTKRGVVEVLVGRLAELGHISEADRPEVVENVLAREKLGSTGLGHGVAVPHCRTSLTEKFVGVLGLAPEGIPFDAVDADPVFGVFLVLAPLDRREQLYELLGRITAIGRDKSQRLRLRGLRTQAAATAFLQYFDPK